MILSDIVTSILSPIGNHYANHATISKGKRSKKRKRQEAKAGKGAIPVPAPAPEIAPFVVTGLNSISRKLQSSSAAVKPDLTTQHNKGEVSSLGECPKGEQASDKLPTAAPHFSAIFVTRSSLPPALQAHLPQLIVTASHAHPRSKPTRLVQLPKGCDARVCKTLGLPRASFIGILENAPNARALIDLVQRCVPEIEVPWLDEVRKAEYQPVNINAVETF